MNKCHIEQLYIHIVISDNINWNPAMPHFKKNTTIFSYSLLPNLWKNFNKWIHTTCSHDKNFSLYHQDSQISLMRTEFYWIHCSTKKMLKGSQHIYNLYLKQFWLRTKMIMVKQSLRDKILRGFRLDFLSVVNNKKYNFILPDYQTPTVHKTQ